MTYKNKVITLSSALAALLLIYAAGLLFSPEGRLSRSEGGKLLSGKAADAVSIRLEVAASYSYSGETPAAVLELSKDGSSWTLSDGGTRLPVQGGRVDAFLESLAGIIRLSPRSDGSGDPAGYGLAEAEASRVLVKDAKGSVLADFYLGGRDLTGKEVYVRPASGKAVYAVDGGFESYATGGRQSWLDLRVFPAGIEAADVTGIAIESSLTTDMAGKAQKPFSWKAQRKDAAWVTSSSAALDSAAMEGLLRSLQALSGEDLAASLPESAFAQPAGRVELSLSKGAGRVLEVGASAGEGRHYLRERGSGIAYLVSDYSLAAVFRPETAFAAKK